MVEDLGRSFNVLHFLHLGTRQNRKTLHRRTYLSTSNDGLQGLTQSKYTRRFHVTGPPNFKSRCSESPESTVVQRLVTRGWVPPLRTPTRPRRDPCQWRCQSYQCTAQGRHAQTRTGHSRTRGPRKHHTLSQERGIRQHEQTGKRTSEDKERADRCGVRASRKDV